ncbi:MAG TPA: FAD-dependent oxidoreductase [Rhodanobacteraceae bacterium]
MLEHVFRAIQLGRLRLRHRVLMGSMHLNLETADDGAALSAFYAERARGGADLIVTGGIAINAAGAGGRTYALLTRPADCARLARVAAAVHAAGGHIALQLFHAGRYALADAFGITPLAPSAVYSRFSRATPQAMGEADIAATIADFAAGARAAVDAGFDAVEIMGSEGYLINQFASPVTNLRDDAWGGTAENRQRFPVAVLTAVRRAVGPEFTVIARTSGNDLVAGSSTAAELDALAVALAKAGADAINVGIGWHESRVPTVQALVPHGMWIDTAARVRCALRAAGSAVPVIGSNRVNTLEQADAFLAAGSVDMISMARPFLADPDLVNHSRAERRQPVNRCTGCNVCLDLSITDGRVTCMVNPRAGHELEYPRAVQAGVAPAARVAVVGAGPAGMQAALTLAERGANVDLFEAEPEIGGQFRFARAVPGKADYGETVRYFAGQLQRLDVRVHVSTTADAALLRDYAHVIVACGVVPRAVTLPCSTSIRVMNYHEAFEHPESIGARVAIIGAGGIAVDLAELLANPDRGALDGSAARAHFAAAHGLDGAPATPSRATRAVTIMRRSGKIGAGIGPSTRWAVVASIREHGVRTLTGVQYRRITADGVWITPPADEAATGTAADELIPADTVIVAAGQLPNTALARALDAAGIAHTVVGGARDATRLTAVRAFAEGLHAATEIAARLQPGAESAGHAS